VGDTSVDMQREGPGEGPKSGAVVEQPLISSAVLQLPDQGGEGRAGHAPPFRAAHTLRLVAASLL